MCGEFQCPACQAQLRRRKGADDMPASQEYWECPLCGLSAHWSRLSTRADRNEVKRRYLALLKQRVEAGERAKAQLRATPQAWYTSGHLALILATGVVALAAGIVVGRKFAGTPSAR